jgi:hypothetical protein
MFFVYYAKSWCRIEIQVSWHVTPCWMVQRITHILEEKRGAFIQGQAVHKSAEDTRYRRNTDNYLAVDTV